MAELSMAKRIWSRFWWRYGVFWGF